MQCLKHEQLVLARFAENHGAQPRGFRHDKTRAASQFERLQKHS